MKGQKWFFICVFIALALIIQTLSCPLSNQIVLAQQDTKFRLYEDDGHGVRIDYPGSSWIVKEGIKSGSGNVVAFISKTLGFAHDLEDGSTQSGGVHVLGIFVKDLLPVLGHNNISLDEYTNVKLDYLPTLLSIKKLDNFTLANQPGYQIEFEYEWFNGIQTWTVKDDKAYDIIYLNNLDQSKKNKDYNTIILHMIDSFKITK